MSVPVRIVVAAGLAALLASACAHDAGDPDLRFSIEDGAFRNEFYRDGPIAAHVVLKSAEAARLVVAFPAGNSGAGLWFAPRAAPVRWKAPRRIEAVTQTLDDGGVRRGVRFETQASTSRLDIDKAIVSNIRVLRDYGYAGTTPAIVDAAPVIEARKAAWERRRIDGDAGYYLSVETLNGVIRREGSVGSVSMATGESALRLRITALTGDAPLTGIAESTLLSDRAARDRRLRNVLAFLSYDEKLLAGSWQYDTYFGRDTLMTLALLGPALRAPAVEAGLSSVLDRLSATGEVAHEEDIGEYAHLRRAADGAVADDAPILDYKMIDDDFMLAPVLAQFLLDAPDGRERAAAFLARLTPRGESYRQAVIRNFEFVIEAARPYALAPHWSRFIRVRSDDPPVGNWRDSSAGLGGGVYPYDVNVALVPAALTAVRRLASSGILGDEASLTSTAAEAARYAKVWLSTAASRFDAVVDAQTAQQRIEAAARRIGVSAASGGRAGEAIEFPALALDPNGAPVMVMHSDIAYLLMFGEPGERDIDMASTLVLTPFPAGLMTPAGMAVANAHYAPDLVDDFGPDRYHGSVVWSWQQALMAAGMERQLGRSDLSAGARSRLDEALGVLRRAIRKACAYQSSELWTWTVEAGRIVRTPFGQQAGDETESNAAQLWSTVFLAGDDISCTE